MSLDVFFDVMMTFNGVRLRYVVFVCCERHKCMRFSVLQSNFRGYSCTNIMTEKWKNLYAATAFQILYVYFKQISVEKKSQLYCELLENISFRALFNLTLRIN